MRLLVAIPLTLCFLFLATGSLEYLHALDHHHRDAAAANVASLPPSQAPLHNDFNCRLHAQLHMPLITVAWVPLLVCFGLFAALLTALTPSLVPQHTPTAFHCRGPPSC